MPWSIGRGDNLDIDLGYDVKRTTLVYVGFQKDPQGEENFSFKVKSFDFMTRLTDDQVVDAILNIKDGNAIANANSDKDYNAGERTRSPLGISLKKDVHEIFFYLGVDNWYFRKPAFIFKMPDANSHKKFTGLKWFSDDRLPDPRDPSEKKRNGAIRLVYDNTEIDEALAFSLLVNINQEERVDGATVLFNTPLEIDPIIRNDP